MMIRDVEKPDWNDKTDQTDPDRQKVILSRLYFLLHILLYSIPFLANYSIVAFFYM